MSATGFGPTWDDALSPATAGRTWDDALSPAAARLAGRYEAAWKAAPTSARPDPADFLPADPAERPGALLALLRADMTLRWEAGEPVAVEWYHARHPGVDGQVLAALLYEEFCLRTEADQRPDPAEYPARFPAVADQVRRLLDLHCFIEDEVPDSTFPSRPSDELLPEAQQTIAGFYLAEELGRGAFARVFLARERQLADRPVALKVARGGSGEPQTLARLQHTHIVPIFSYRVDPVTKLHLLCMPYFGRATLAHVLAEPGIKAARAGAALVAALERLDPPRAAAPGTSPASAGREALAGRSFPRAIAWWGARLAEALQHAHDRGILHRDIKPSNVLVTGDGMPMLLDFNLAQGTGRDAEDDEPERLGGTLAYMAPEHLEAVAEGVGDRVNNRSDLYALGVVLYEALTGARPFAIPDERRFGPDTLLRLAEHRKFAAPSVRGPRPDLPPELDAVVRRCLAPEPADRYASAAELAVDLQAVADDGPLRFTREPQPSRTLRWLRRNRRRFAAAAAVAAALLTLAAIVSRAREDRLRVRADATKHFLEAMLTLEKAKSTDQKDQYQLAAEQFKWIAELTEGRPELQEIRARASEQSQLAWEVYSLRDRADDLFKHSEGLRLALLDEDSDLKAASHELQDLLKPFFVLKNPRWTDRPELTLLDNARRARLPVEVDELLFLWIVALEKAAAGDPGVAHRAVGVCDVALGFAQPTGPWRALRARCATAAGGPAVAAAPTVAEDRPEAESSAHACFLWGVLRQRERDLDRAIAWLDRATRLEPDAFWPHFYLSYCHDLAGHADEALVHANAAVTLRPDSSWARFNRAQLLRARRDWDRAQEDLRRALDHETGTPGTTFLKAHIELGLVLQALGDFPGARAAYDTVLTAGAGSPELRRAARLNRASLDAQAGAEARARAGYLALRADDPDDPDAALGLALLALQRGDPARAEADLDRLVKARPGSARAWALRARTRLALGQADAAVADAARARELDPSPAHDRLWTRVLLASGRLDGLPLDHPEDLAALPAAGPALAEDLRRAAGRLATATDAPARLTRAVLLSALGDPGAPAEASRAVERAPGSAARLVRARVLRRAGDRAGALADVQTGLDLDPNDPRLWELRGLLQVEQGRAEAALADLDRALRLGAEGPRARAARARALELLGRDQAALDDWTRTLALDPEDPRACLDRARTLRRLGRIDSALADLEQAAVLAGDRPELLGAIAVGYACCLPERPDRLPRVIALARLALGLAPVPVAARSG